MTVTVDGKSEREMARRRKQNFDLFLGERSEQLSAGPEGTEWNALSEAERRVWLSKSRPKLAELVKQYPDHSVGLRYVDADTARLVLWRDGATQEKTVSL